MIWQDEIRSATDFHQAFSRLPSTLAVLRRHEATGTSAARPRPLHDCPPAWQEVDQVTD